MASKTSLQSALALIESTITSTAIPELPPGDIQEIINGQMPLAEEGTYILAFRTDYEWSTHPPTHPTNSTAILSLAIQVKKRSLDALNSGAFDEKPQQALMYIAGALREFIEAKSTDGTWASTVPGMELTYLSDQVMFAEGLDIGVLEITLRLGGFDD